MSVQILSNLQISRDRGWPQKPVELDPRFSYTSAPPSEARIAAMFSATCKPVFYGGGSIKAVPHLNDMKSWTDRLGRSNLRTFNDSEGHFWIEQNAAKASRWARLVREGHEMAWEFGSPGGTYTGRVLIDGEIYTPSEATKKFIKGEG